MVVAILLESESPISNILISYGFTFFFTNNKIGPIFHIPEKYIFPLRE